jgi:hypothetical protein
MENNIVELEKIEEINLERIIEDLSGIEHEEEERFTDPFDPEYLLIQNQYRWKPVCEG